ncbi:LLM class flavin-dependent oxidoreductase [Amycolatopsis pithecellobii]|uniref:LLM class flavin-dependent oxidoreductase n=1 Tax=Amycolatopsis pithecellobii TaxID=664692 RepID=A0A6N7ZBF8_9PSEU|nr:LLM class flavin-dependent oxidoreductase [Amycolatopsis pithecellobii]MTD59015.1 LLM class flavin-dependent oxidoreductase [Amycolatopsis pithecellobii]
MQIGIGLPNQVRNVDPTVIPRWAGKSEQAGFSTLGTLGRNAYPGVADTVTLAAAAGATSRIGLTPAVLLAPTWPATLLAKEVAGIDGVSGGRLTLALGVGGRPDDFVAPEYGMKGRGARFDRDLRTFHDVWAGEPVGGGSNPAVPHGTRQVPILMGGGVPATMQRMARWGIGYIGGAGPAAMLAPVFEQARAAWTEAGREGSPRLVAIAYFTLGDPDSGRANILDFYAGSDFAELSVQAASFSPDAIKTIVAQWEEVGADELILFPWTPDLAEIDRLAEVVF